MLQARKIGDDEHELKFDPRFPGLSVYLHLSTSNGKALSFFVRNGQMLTSLGQIAGNVMVTAKGPYSSLPISE